MYKNLTLFVLDAPISTLNLSDNHVFTPCTAQQETSSGFVPVQGNLTYVDANGYTHVALKTETKRVPSDIKKELLKKRIADLPFHPTKSELDVLKSTVHFELLAKAFPISKIVEAYITPEKIIVNTSSLKQAEALISQLRSAQCELVAIPLDIQDISFKMTDWVDKGDTLPDSLIVTDKATLSGIESTIKYKNYVLECNEIKSHIAEGLQVTEVSLECDVAKFTLTETSQFKGLKFDYESEGFEDDCLLLADVVDKLLAITA